MMTNPRSQNRGCLLRHITAAAALSAAVLFLAACESGFDSSLPIMGAAPKSVQLTGLDGALMAQWTKVSSAQGVAPTYEVYYSTNDNPASAQKFESVTAGESQLVTSKITGLTNHTTYYVWVKSVFGSLGTSNFSPVSSGKPVPPPQSMSAISVTAGEEMLELRWAPVTDAFTYNVFYSTAGGAEPPDTAGMVSVSTTGAVISGLQNGTPYTIWARAENTAGKSPGYSSASGTPLAAGSAPAAAPAVPSIKSGNKKLTLTWEQVPGVPLYKIFYSTSNDSGAAQEFGTVIPADVPVITADLTRLTNGSLYYVWLKSSNSKGDSSFSVSASGTPQAPPAIDWGNAQFVLGEASAEYIFAQDLPPSVFFPEGRPNTDRLPRVQETALGDLFTDAACWYVREVLEEQVDFVFLNGSYIDNALMQGEIRLGSLMGIIQPDARADKIILLTLTGAQLKQFFGVTSGDTPVPNSVAAVTHMGRGGHDTGDFGMVSKEINYTIEYPKAPSSGPELKNDDADNYWHGRIKAGTLKFNGVDIDDGRNYRICTTDYNASGAYYLILNTGATDRHLFDIPFYKAVAEYIYDKGTVTPKTDGRIKLVGGVPLPPPWQPGTWTD